MILKSYSLLLAWNKVLDLVNLSWKSKVNTESKFYWFLTNAIVHSVGSLDLIIKVNVQWKS